MLQSIKRCRIFILSLVLMGGVIFFSIIKDAYSVKKDDDKKYRDPFESLLPPLPPDCPPGCFSKGNCPPGCPPPPTCLKGCYPNCAPKCPSSCPVDCTLEPEPPNITIEGVLWGGTNPSAVIDGKVYKVGENLKGIDAQLYKIEKNEVYIFYQGRVFMMNVKKREGKR